VADCHDDAIRRRAAHCENPLAELTHADGLAQGQRVRSAALVVLRRDHPNIGRELPGDLLQHFEATRLDAVVVGDEDAH